MIEFVFDHEEDYYRQRCCFTYRGYQIVPDPGCPFGKWEFIHDDYDGAPMEPGGPPADPRHGHGATLREVYEQINELVEEYPEKHEGKEHRVLLCHGADR